MKEQSENGPADLNSVPGAARAATSQDLSAVMELILDQQAKADRNIASLGIDRAGLTAELEDLEPPWFETLRVLRSDNGAIAGAILADWSVEARRAWIHGPWIHADGDVWLGLGTILVEAVTSQLPAVIERSTVIAAVEHRGMADLAVRLGWSPTEVNHVLIADFETINAWTSTETARLRSMTPEDVADLGPIHDLEFPKTYYSAGDLASRSSRGEQIVLIAERDDGSFAGYIAGQIQPDGDGYIDFLAVSPSARRTGIGMGLVVAMCQQLVSRSSTQRVCLTVQDGRAPARRLYESLGFRYGASIVGFESMVPLVTR